MLFRVLSDLHLDINRIIPFNIEGDNSVITLIAGDISGDPIIREEWISKQIENGYKGFFIEGNHIVYHNENKSINQIQDDLYNKFYDQFVFMENNYQIITEENERVLIIGCTLWTDYEYDGCPVVSRRIANLSMNDFSFRCVGEFQPLRYMTTEDQIRWHNESKLFIEKTLLKMNGKYDKAVILTHHAPSKQSVNRSYKDSKLNPAYVSNLENLILKHPKIKLWVHGHLHYNSDYMVGNCRIICNPRGYCKYYEDCGFNPNLIIEV